MRFDLSRQPLVPAFLTLLFFTVLTVWRMPSRTPFAPVRCEAPAACADGASSEVFRPDRGGVRSAESEQTPTLRTADSVAASAEVDTLVSMLPDSLVGRALVAATPQGHSAAEATPRADLSAAAMQEGLDDSLRRAGLRREGVAAADRSDTNPAGPGCGAAAGTTGSTLPTVSARAAQPAAGGPCGAVAWPSELLARFQAARPGWAQLLAALSLLYAGLCLGRMTVRRNLYGSGTCIAMSLFGMAVCLLPAGGESLAASLAAALSALSIKNCGRAYRNGYAFDSIFRAALYLGAIPLLVPAALPLYLLLPFAVLLFRRTVRETLVAIFALLLPVAVFLYVDWGAGEAIATAALRPLVAFATGVPLEFLCRLSLAVQLALGAMTGLALVASGLFLAHLYAVGSKARFILLYTLGVTVLTGLLVCVPSASPALFGLLAVPVAILVPLLFVRLRSAFAVPLYLLLALAALGSAFMQ